MRAVRRLAGHGRRCGRRALDGGRLGGIQHEPGRAEELQRVTRAPDRLRVRIPRADQRRELVGLARRVEVPRRTGGVERCAKRAGDGDVRRQMRGLSARDGAKAGEERRERIGRKKMRNLGAARANEMRRPAAWPMARSRSSVGMAAGAGRAATATTRAVLETAGSKQRCLRSGGSRTLGRRDRRRAAPNHRRDRVRRAPPRNRRSARASHRRRPAPPRCASRRHRAGRSEHALAVARAGTGGAPEHPAASAVSSRAGAQSAGEHGDDHAPAEPRASHVEDPHRHRRRGHGPAMEATTDLEAVLVVAADQKRMGGSGFSTQRRKDAKAQKGAKRRGGTAVAVVVSAAMAVGVIAVTSNTRTSHHRVTRRRRVRTGRRRVASTPGRSPPHTSGRILQRTFHECGSEAPPHLRWGLRAPCTMST